jgi:preprotein translocase subunit SecG
MRAIRVIRELERGYMSTFLLTLFVVICLLLIVVVLLQKGRGGGLGGAFGGGMTSSAFGTRTGDVFTWVTIVLTSLFLLLAIVNTVALRQKPPELKAAFSPASGPIEKETAVTMTVPGAAKQEVAAGTVNVYYTTDGTDPTDKSAKYAKEAVPVQPGQTLRARVYRGDKAGPIVEAFFGRPDQYPGPQTAPTGEPMEKPAASLPAAPASEPASRPAPRRATTMPAAPAATTAPASSPAP